MEQLTTLMLCSAKGLFVIAIYRLCSLQFALDPSGSLSFSDSEVSSHFPTLQGFALFWMLLRGVADIYMSIHFLVCVARMTHQKTFTSWFRFALATMTVDSFFMILLIKTQAYLGLEMFALVIDGIIKLFMACVFLNLKRNLFKENKDDVFVQKPLLSRNN